MLIQQLYFRDCVTEHDNFVIVVCAQLDYKTVCHILKPSDLILFSEQADSAQLSILTRPFFMQRVGGSGRPFHLESTCVWSRDTGNFFFLVIHITVLLGERAIATSTMALWGRILVNAL